MVTTLTVILAIFVVANVWIFISAVKRENKREAQLQERIREFDEASDVHITELQGAKHRINEAMKELTHLRKEHEKVCKKAYELEKIVASGCPCSECTDPKPEGQDIPFEGVETEAFPTVGDYNDLHESYKTLSAEYTNIKDKYDKPSKTYLVRHIVDAYKVGSLTALANALGVSKSSISQMLKKK